MGNFIGADICFSSFNQWNVLKKFLCNDFTDINIYQTLRHCYDKDCLCIYSRKHLKFMSTKHDYFYINQRHRECNIL